MKKKDIASKYEKIRDDAEKKKAVKYCFRGRKGQLALSLLDDNCFVNQSTYVKGDPQGTAFNEGIRAALLKIKYFIDLPDMEIDRRAEEKIKTLKEYERNRSNSNRSSSTYGSGFYE